MNSEEMSNAVNNLINSNNIPDNLKEMLNQFANQASASKDDNSEIPKENKDNSPNSINPETITNIMNMINNSKNSNIDIEMIMKMKTIMDKLNSTGDDPRANLLLSLKPYLNESRRSKVDQYAKIFSMSKVMDIFNQTGGEDKK